MRLLVNMCNNLLGQSAQARNNAGWGQLRLSVTGECSKCCQGNTALFHEYLWMQHHLSMSELLTQNADFRRPHIED